MTRVQHAVGHGGFHAGHIQTLKQVRSGAELGDAGLQPAMTSIKPTTGAMDLNRDTGVLLLTKA